MEGINQSAHHVDIDDELGPTAVGAPGDVLGGFKSCSERHSMGKHRCEALSSPHLQGEDGFTVVCHFLSQSCFALLRHVGVAEFSFHTSPFFPAVIALGRITHKQIPDHFVCNGPES
eukprot:2428759-Amphidinium_carterae.1